MDHASCRRERIGLRALLLTITTAVHVERSVGQMHHDQGGRQNKAGAGHIALDLHGDHAVFSALSYRYPLKILSPRIHEPAVAIAYLLTYGGGLVSGDRIDLSVTVASGASLLLLTQVRR